MNTFANNGIGGVRSKSHDLLSSVTLFPNRRPSSFPERHSAHHPTPTQELDCRVPRGQLHFAVKFATMVRETRERRSVTGTKLESRIQAFVEQCKAARMKVTPQRLLIFRALVRDHSHPSPDKIFRSIKRSHPTISHATVYTTLEAFARHGIIARLTPLHDTVRFDPMTEPHHHLVCVHCKEVTNIHEPDFDALAIPEQVRRHNTVLGHSVFVNVICPACRKAARAR